MVEPIEFISAFMFAYSACTAVRCESETEPFADSVKLPRKSREEGAKAYAQQYANVLESFARRAPYNWFNFYEFWEPEEAPARQRLTAP